MNNKIYELVINKLLSEFSSMGGGAVGGVSTPLGTGPKAGSRGENIYKSSKATDKKHRSKKKQNKVKSVQWYLKNGPSKKIKEAGLIAVVNLAIPANDLTRDNHTPEDACKIFEDNGAEVVGLNCFRGPAHTMKHLIRYL